MKFATSYFQSVRCQRNYRVSHTSLNGTRTTERDLSEQGYIYWKVFEYDVRDMFSLKTRFKEFL